MAAAVVRDVDRRKHTAMTCKRYFLRPERAVGACDARINLVIKIKKYVFPSAY